MSYYTQDSFEADVDDPPRPGRDLSIEDMASPQISRAATKLSQAWIDRCKGEVAADVLEPYMEDGCSFGSPEERLFEDWQRSREFVPDLRDRSELTQVYHEDRPEPVPGYLYDPGYLELTADGRFHVLVSNEDHLFDTLAQAERWLFEAYALGTMERPEPEPLALTWETEGWKEPRPGDPPYARANQVFVAKGGGQLMAVMVIQRIPTDDEAYR